MADSSGSVDITDLIDKMQGTFVAWAVNFLFESATQIPAFAWLKLPLVSTIIKAFIAWGAEKLATSVVMQGFFLNTAVEKSKDAAEYITAINVKDKLAADATDADYERLERAEIEAFNRLVRLSA